MIDNSSESGFFEGHRPTSKKRHSDNGEANQDGYGIVQRATAALIFEGERWREMHDFWGPGAYCTAYIRCPSDWGISLCSVQ